jgi:phosphodiesterase/alkaline phosphatase D-like protein
LFSTACSTQANGVKTIPSEGFSFAIQADSHLDQNTDIDLYKQTLHDIKSEQPAFLVDLGDTSMAEKLCKTQEEVEKRYTEVMSYLRLIGSIPLYPVTGNHDGENGWDAGKSLLTWERAARQKYLSMPLSIPYTGNTTTANYYSFVKDDAQFIVLDPFTFTTQKARGNTDGWNYTLGKTQYDWLKNTLENSTAKYKFVFIHNLVGGDDKDARGGAEAAKYYEWGGYNADGSYGFDQMRPGWGEPIHQILVEYGVNVVFHGHDHFYARQELDGIIYQLVPQPGGKENTVQSAHDYGYISGTILPPAGHMWVTVSLEEVKVKYVSSTINGEQNGIVADQYEIK